MTLGSQGRTYYKTDVVKDLTGAAVDLTTFSNFIFNVFSSQPNGGYPATPITTSTIAAVGNADGTMDITLDPTNLTLLNAGTSYNIGIYAQLTGGPNPSELIGTGTMSVKQT
jgi:hypothetical protein